MKETHRSEGKTEEEGSASERAGASMIPKMVKTS